MTRHKHAGRNSLLCATFAAIVLAGCNSGGETDAPERDLQTVTATVGDITRVVGATGKIVPREEVMVGSEVSGRVIDVLVDFNSPVTAGQVLARIDPTSFDSRVRQIQSRIESARADIEVQQASIKSAQVNLDNARLQLDRREGLFEQQAISQAQLEGAQRDVGVSLANLELAQARLSSSRASLQQQRAQLEEARADLERTTIYSPIDGVVIDRKIDPGQTVQASFSAPELFVIAADLSNIQVEATIVESDVAGLEAGDTARFTVDAYPDDPVEGVVEQLRLKSQEANNIVSYTAVIGASNPSGVLMPGMTANLEIITEVKSGARRLPVSVERFRPSPDDLAKFEAASEDGETEAGLLAPTYARLRTIGMDEARVSQFAARIEPATQRMRDMINDPTRSFMHTPMRIAMNEMIDNQLGTFLNPDERQAYAAQVSLERTIRPVDLWVRTPDGKMTQKTVKLGLSDGSFVEVVEGLGDDEAVVTGIGVPQARRGGGRPGAARS
ncbi:MAG: efflux RND transporter periplasmic adaptor subunit [Pseudomonadota bacterium]